jgi:two-component system cell cycle sensor histidine kinase/response regulator CckA
MLTYGTPIPFSDVPSGGARAVAGAPADVPGFDVLFERAPLPMWICDAENLRFLAANFSALKAYGWSREEFLAMTMDRILPAKDVAAFLEYRRAVESRGAGLNQTQNWRHKTKNGTVIAVQTSWQNVTFRGRRALLVTIHDRTGHLRAEEETRELTRVLSLAADAIIVCTLDREIRFWNKGAEKVYGWTSEQAIGRKVDDLLKIDIDTCLKCMSGLLEKGDWNGQMVHSRRESGEAVVNSRWTLGYDDETAQPKSVLLINSDITETKKLESQFLRAQRLESIGTLASGIAHDLNNILSPILMATGILRGSVGPDDQAMVDIIEGSAERGAGIVKQVLTFARGVEGERVLLQPKHLLTEMVKVMNQTFPKNIDIKTQFAPELWTVQGDATQLHQILLNLCVNARDAMSPGGGTLRVSCENVDVDQQVASMNPGATMGPHVCFSVTDTGTGMTPEVMEKIFNPFFTTKEQGKGTGLGLATVIGIVKGHKGFLSLQSEVGVGTTFKIHLPANREACTEEKQTENLSDLRGNGELVLVVDDEMPIREVIVGTLEAHNYRCYTAEDGQDALAMYFERRGAISLIITDLHMAMMDGITLTKSVKKLTPDARVIVSSGHINKENQTILEGLNVKAMLEKPYTAEKLLRCVKNALAAAPAVSKAA